MQGSFVGYQDFYGTSAPDGSWFREERANASWRFADGDWTGACDVNIVEHWAWNGTWDDRTEHAVYTAAHPPHWPPFDSTDPPAVGSWLSTWFLDGCTITHTDWIDAGTSTANVTVNGHAQPVATFVATDTHDGSPNDFRSDWRQDSGLVVSWHWSQSNTAHDGGITNMG